MRAGVEKLCKDRYKDAKHDFKSRHFIDRGGFEVEGHLRDSPPEDVTLPDWQNYVDFVTSPGEMSRSQKNKANRSLLPFTSKHGSKSYVARRAERVRYLNVVGIILFM